jgi:hypothetical protein
MFLYHTWNMEPSDHRWNRGWLAGWRRVHGLFQGFRQGASRSVEVQFVNFIWWIAFVLDGVLSDRSNTTCQIRGLFVRIDSMSFRSAAGESLGTDILHFGYQRSIGHLLKCKCVGIRWRSEAFYDDKVCRGLPAVSKGSRPFERVVPQ